MRCVHCGNQVLASESVCRHCGARVVRPSVESGGGSSSRLIAVAAALIVVGIAAWMILPNREAILGLVDELRTAPSEAVPPAGTPGPAPAQESKPEAATPPPRSPTPTTPPAVDRPTTPAPVKKAASAPARSTQPRRVGGDIPTPTKVKDVRPVYPAVAQAARVQGVVIIEATIGTNGSVNDARVLRSAPLLDEAALEAVRQWVFTPTLLNGVPVPVIMTVTVQFKLQ